jgi:hypothetical protein
MKSPLRTQNATGILCPFPAKARLTVASFGSGTHLIYLFLLESKLVVLYNGAGSNGHHYVLLRACAELAIRAQVVART